MYENGMNPGVHLLGLYFKISDEHTLPHIFFGGSIPPNYYPRNEESDLFDWILFMGKTISIDWFTTVWSLFVSSLPVRFQTILKWFRKRLFLLFFFGTRLWQSVTMLIDDKLSNQKELKSRDLLPSRSGVVREWVIICASNKVTSHYWTICYSHWQHWSDRLIDLLICWLTDSLIDWMIYFLIGWLTDLSASWLSGWLIDWLVLKIVEWIYSPELHVSNYMHNAALLRIFVWQ